jgi:hypothetical protein
VSVEFLGDEHRRATVVQDAYDVLVAKVEQLRCALDLCEEGKAILDEIKGVLHAKVRAQAGTFVWMDMETDQVTPGESGGLTVLQVLYKRQTATPSNQTDDEAPEWFVDAIQDFMIVRDGRTPARKVRKTTRNAWKDDPGADRRIREEPPSPGGDFRSPYRGQPEKYDPDVVLAFADGIARAIGRPRISWTRGTGTPDYASRGVVLDVLVAAVEWAMRLAWLHAGPPGTEPPKVKAGGIIGILKAKRPLTKSTD